MTAFYDEASYIYVVYSKPGYGYVTDKKGYWVYDRKNDGFSEMWKDPTKDMNEVFTFIQTGDKSCLDYVFPFKNEWRKFDYLYEQDEQLCCVNKIVLPEGMESLEDYAYVDADTVEELVLPKTIERISAFALLGDNAFIEPRFVGKYIRPQKADLWKCIDDRFMTYFSDDGVVDRGKKMAVAQNFENVEKTDISVRGIVKSSQKKAEKKYRVSIVMDKCGDIEFGCNCLASYDGARCKHMVALYIYSKNNN